MLLNSVCQLLQSTLFTIGHTPYTPMSLNMKRRCILTKKKEKEIPTLRTLNAKTNRSNISYREDIEQTPTEFLCEKIFDACFSHDLWELCAITERVR